MISDLDLARLCRALYAYPGDAPRAWGHLDSGDDDGVCWSLMPVVGADVVVLRGSVTLEDWLHDLTAVANPLDTSTLGPVHPGFFLGLPTLVRDVISITQGRPIIITGHSLGAGRASILAALLAVAGHPPVARVVFGEPKPGFTPLAKLLAAVPGRSYRCGHPDKNEHDLITDVPFSFPPEEYVHPTAPTDLFVVPLAGDPWGIFRYHHIALYEAALAALKPEESNP